MIHFDWCDDTKLSITFEETYKNAEFTSENTALTPQKGNTHVYICYFHDMKGTEGGAIFFYQTGSYLIVEKSTFFFCSASQYSGAIRVTAGNSIISFICGYNCFSSQNDGFCSVSNDPLNEKNTVIDSSISACKAQFTYIMAHKTGYVHFQSVNISRNIANSCCGIATEPTIVNAQTNLSTNVNFCSFSNNTGSNCVHFSYVVYNIRIKHQIKNSNIIENQSPGTFHSKGETMIFHCCIISNVDPYFSTNDQGSSITLELCIYDSKNHTGIGSVSSLDDQRLNSFLLALSFFETRFCAYSTKCGVLTNHLCFMFSHKSYFIYASILIFMSE